MDRDGVINRDRGHVHTRAATDWVPGVFELVAAARDASYVVLVVTNQAGIARGMYTVDDFLQYTGWIHESFRAQGAPLLATYYCPHHPTVGDGALTGPCGCRKPEPGMIEKAAKDWSIDLDASLLVGDKESDMQAGRAAGIRHLWLVQKEGLPSFERLLHG
ncbi:hypothetical protein GCM10008101_26630 [Lysobacter xinjiangensis]|uniref:D,D-heptose 1,7-bisphosphate phosphatase n=1 Tax=Cognatilysobacter xinjiangensis TaxID=546892 RepID=A0ABQ3C6Q7_9GAMM|nr:HAD family hydrolase [Lysobacter xinjiangensis]GGZ70940.1 hypothetical protein GCM10008101_26630 [Lysobacter xinjiangensis]